MENDIEKGNLYQKISKEDLNKIKIKYAIYGVILNTLFSIIMELFRCFAK